MENFKIIIAFVLALFVISCANDNKKEEVIDGKVDKDENIVVEKTENLVANFDWLIGDWKRNNEDKGKETHEVWSKNNEYFFVGVGYTLQNKDTLSKENMVLFKSDNMWYLNVQTKSDTEPTTFDLTTYSDSMFVCVNNQNEFPSKIQYFRLENKLGAKLQGGDTKLSFEFDKLN